MPHTYIFFKVLASSRHVSRKRMRSHDYTIRNDGVVSSSLTSGTKNCRSTQWCRQAIEPQAAEALRRREKSNVCSSRDHREARRGRLRYAGERPDSGRALPGLEQIAVKIGDPLLAFGGQLQIPDRVADIGLDLQLEEIGEDRAEIAGVPAAELFHHADL